MNLNFSVHSQIIIQQSWWSKHKVETPAHINTFSKDSMQARIASCYLGGFTVCSIDYYNFLQSTIPSHIWHFELYVASLGGSLLWTRLNWIEQRKDMAPKCPVIPPVTSPLVFLSIPGTPGGYVFFLPCFCSYSPSNIPSAPHSIAPGQFLFILSVWAYLSPSPVSLPCTFEAELGATLLLSLSSHRHFTHHIIALWPTEAMDSLERSSLLESKDCVLFFYCLFCLSPYHKGWYIGVQ